MGFAGTSHALTIAVAAGTSGPRSAYGLGGCAVGADSGGPGRVRSTSREQPVAATQRTTAVRIAERTTVTSQETESDTSRERNTGVASIARVLAIVAACARIDGDLTAEAAD
jgi:hypothetical protein